MLFKTSSFSTVKSITSLIQSCAFSKSDEHDVNIVPCGTDELICNNNGVLKTPFIFSLSLSLLKRSLIIPRQFREICFDPT